MTDSTKLTAIRWRRILFSLHLLVWLIVRLAVGSLPQMPPAGTYDNLHLWGLIAFGHSLVVAYLDGRDRAGLPFRQLNRLIVPRERRWSLLALDAAVWIIFTMAIASRTISLDLIMRYVTVISLLWLALISFGLAHIMLVLYAEIHDRAAHKRKNDEKAKSAPPLLLGDDGELSFDSPEYESADKKRSDKL